MIHVPVYSYTSSENCTEKQSFHKLKLTLHLNINASQLQIHS